PLKRGYDVPIVSLFSSVDAKVDTVNINIGKSMDEAVNALNARGHKKIAFISEKLTSLRAALYKVAMYKAENTDIILAVSNERFEKAGVEGIKTLFAKRSDITAVICAYDYIAFGAIKQLKKMGLRVPEDVSVVGIDNISTSEYAETSLSTIGCNPREVSHIVYNLIKEKLKNPYFRSKQEIMINAQFILRESIGDAKK
ncbi:MAG: substrate-binding domain-containing protein, partial [Clostridia bacterium]|nr:substrate-binding domain-containing protein [Clostridia bacterium]